MFIDDSNKVSLNYFLYKENKKVFEIYLNRRKSATTIICFTQEKNNVMPCLLFPLIS